MTNLNAFLIAGLIVCSLNAVACEISPTPVRTNVEKRDEVEVLSKQIVLGTASLPPGSAIAFHTHPGDDAEYVLNGTLILKIKGQPDRLFHADDHFFNPRGLVHSVVAAADGEGGTALSTRVVDKIMPIAIAISQ